MVAALPGIEIERSPADTRDYRAVMLDNGLEALVVSDPDADKAAAALTVNVGSANDPDGRPGLAHFLEHMLFLGTAKYPDPGEYSRFLAEHGGCDNAATSFAHTSYFFDVDAAHLEGALDRFAQFFISPRFDREYVERERMVVHSEYVSRRRSDRLRSFAAWRQTLDPRHPISRFMAGNAQTLADRPGAPIRDELVDFYQRTYSSHLMKLVVVGREPLDVLEDWVRVRFAAVPHRDFEPPCITVPLYPEGLLPARLDIEPVRDLRTISCSFAIAPVQPHHPAHPLALVSHLLGHEGPGSLLSALKARGWAEGLSAGLGMRHRDFATFGITIHATEAGLANHTDVIASVFACLDLIGQKGIEPHYHEELAHMARIGFRFLEKTEPRSHAVSIAGALHFYPVREVLTAPWRFDDFDPELVRRSLCALTPDRVLVAVVAQGVTTDTVAPFHDTPYRVSPIPAGTVARWRDAAPDGAVSLPEPNPFVPRRLSLIDRPAAELRPDRIACGPGFDLWHRADVEFGQPRTNFYFAVRSPIANDSPRHTVLSTLLVRMANDALNEFAYPAALAGQTCALSRQRRGITVRLSGWSDKQDLLVARIASTLHTLPLPPGRFEAQKSEYARHLRNVDERKPFRRAMSDVRALLTEPNWSDDALLEALETVELEDLRVYGAQFLERGEIVALAHGNITAEDSEALGGVLERELLASMRAERVAQTRVVRLDPGMRFARWLASEHEDHALAVYAQGRDGSLAERAKFALIARATRRPVFPRAAGRTRDRVHRFRDPPAGTRGAGARAGDPIPFDPARDPPPARRRLHRAFRRRAARDAERGLRAPPSRGGEFAAEGRDTARQSHRTVLGRDQQGELRIRPARAVSRRGSRRHPGRTRGCGARPHRRPGDGPRGSRRGFEPRASRQRRGVPRCGVGCRYWRIQARAALLRQIVSLRKIQVAEPGQTSSVNGGWQVPCRTATIPARNHSMADRR